MGQCNCFIHQYPQEPSINTDRVKIYQEMNTMSKTLSLSLKERLMNSQNPVISGRVPIEQKENKKQADDMSSIYFEYEKKIHMNKVGPKIEIPPLFANRSGKIYEQSQCSNSKNQNDDSDLDMKNFYSIFSREDENAKKILNIYIKKEMKKCIINQY